MFSSWETENSNLVAAVDCLCAEGGNGTVRLPQDLRC
jgi:hypothetical protein